MWLTNNTRASAHNIRTASRHDLQWSGGSVVLWVSLLWCRSLWALFDWILWTSRCHLQKQGIHSTRTNCSLSARLWFSEYTYKLMKRKTWIENKRNKRQTLPQRMLLKTILIIFYGLYKSRNNWLRYVFQLRGITFLGMSCGGFSLSVNYMESACEVWAWKV